MKRSLLGYLILVFLLGSCNLVKKVSSRPDAYESYTEDLSENRITFPDLAEEEEKMASEATTSSELAIDEDLEIAMKSFKDSNKSERYWNGYTVLVYSGVDRDDAFKTRNDLFTNFPDLKSDMQYQQPRYLIKVGKFINRVEALAYFHKLQDTFPSARIIQDRFQREGYINSDPVQNVERENQDFSDRI